MDAQTLIPRSPLVLIRGAGDLASGVALRLHRAGFAVVMSEIARPTVIRRTVAFAEAVYEGRVWVEDVEGVRVAGLGGNGKAAIDDVLGQGVVPVVIDPEAALRWQLRPALLVDAIMAKRNLGTRITDAPLVIGLGPGFVAGQDVHAVIETNRGHTLGRVIMQGAARPDTGVPGEVNGLREERIIRSAVAGVFAAISEIGATVTKGQVVGSVGETPVCSGIDGVIRGLLRTGLEVTPGFKIGDVDPRGDPALCQLVSDKALAIAGGVLEAACGMLRQGSYER